MGQTFLLSSGSEEETKYIAQRVAPVFESGDLLVLVGDLGAGKTHFVKGFATGRGSDIQVTSPTFGIANFYPSPTGTLLHLDLYRIESEEELADLGLEEYLENSIGLVEWGNKFPDYLGDYLLLTISTLEDGSRELSFSAKTSYYESKLEAIKQILREK